MTRFLCQISCPFCLFLFFSPRAVSDHPKDAKETILSAVELDRREKIAGNDVNKLLDLVAMVEAKEGRRLLQRVVSLFKSESLPPHETLIWRRRMAELVPRLATYPEEINDIFSSSAPKGVARQVLYHRFVEQWHYQQHVQIIIIFEGVKGKELRVLTVQLIPPASS